MSYAERFKLGEPSKTIMDVETCMQFYNPLLDVQRVQVHDR